MSRRRQLVTIGLVGLALVGLLVGLTLNRLGNDHQLWEASLTRQGSFILASFRAMGRAGMRHMQSFTQQRLQFLAEEMARIGLVEEVFLIDPQGLILAHSDPDKVGQIQPEAGSFWLKIREDQSRRVRGESPMGEFLPHSFQLIRLFQQFRPPRPFGGQGLGRGRLEVVETEPLLGVVRLSLEEYHAARQALIRQAVGFSVGILGGGLALVAVLLLFHDRRLLRQLKTTTGHIIEQMPAGLLTADRQGRILSANHQARLVWGLEPGKELKGTLADLLPAELGARIAALGSNQILPEEEAELATEQGPIPVVFSAVRLEPSAEDPTAFVILIRDLREVRELEEQLRRSERLAAIGRLSAGVAHEIRNPLSSIRGLAQYLKSKLAKGSAEADYAEVMVQEADRLNRVVSDLLEFARPRPPQTAPTDLNGLVRKVAELVGEKASAQGIELKLDLAGDLDALALDSDQITQVILNLVLNGMESGAGLVEVTTRLRDGKACLLVADDGPGVSQEVRERLFDPFVTTKAKGSGLGLALSQRIAEEHGGWLKYRDRGGSDGRGTAFELCLPGPAGPDESKGAP